MHEAILKSNTSLSVDTYVDGKHRLKDTDLGTLMSPFVTHPEDIEKWSNEFGVVFEMDGNDVMIESIYDHETGLVYWEDEGRTPGNGWTENDETLINSLMMWADLPSYIYNPEPSEPW
jgi:hypothetical protein